MDTNEEVTVYVKDLHLFVTVQFLENPPLVLWLGQNCEDHQSSCGWIEGHKLNSVPFKKNDALGLSLHAVQFLYRKVCTVKHVVFTHFPNDPDVQDHKGSVQKAPKPSRAPREKFGDLITADHKTFNEEGESVNNHRKAVIVQHLATQWIQSYPC